MPEMVGIPLNTVLNMLGDLCLDCQEKVRKYIATYQYSINKDIDGRLHQILETVAKQTGFTVEELQAKDGRRPLVEARREIAVAARRQGISYPRIAAILRKHHTTILHLVQTSPDAIKVDKNVTG